MSGTHLLNLRALADVEVDDYALLRFDGREAISEPFDYRLELIPTGPTTDTSGWIGKLAEWDVTTSDGVERLFAGRIFATDQVASDGIDRIRVRVRPAYLALAYGRATHFIQDKTSLDIFEAMTADVPGLTTSINLSPAPAMRTYSVRYDESEFDYLARLLAHDGIMYFFKYDRGAGTYRHRMMVSNSAADYVDVEGGAELSFDSNATSSTLGSLTRARRAAPRVHDHHAFDVNKLDTPWTHNATATETWGKVYPHSWEVVDGEAGATADLAARSATHNQFHAQDADTVTGTSDSPAFCAGGRIALTGSDGLAPDRMVLTAVDHTAHDPWMLGERGAATYANSFAAIDATRIFRPSVDTAPRVAPGPVLGTVAEDSAAAGEAKVDDKQRVPVLIAQSRDYSRASKPLPKYVWLPVQQQWAHSTHGAQFFPRIGTRVIIDFLYGNPDLPFVAGTVYTPSQQYPFDPASKVTQSGWRSVTDKNGSISQEFHFEDKPGKEQVYLYTGRDYRRLIDNDDWGIVKRDQTLVVERDRKLTVQGKQDTIVEKTRSVMVTKTSSHESKEKIELICGTSKITMTPAGIVIEATKIEVKATAQLAVSAGATADYKSPMTKMSADATLIFKGGIIMIN